MIRRKTKVLTHRYTVGLDPSLTGFGVYLRCTENQTYNQSYRLTSQKAGASDEKRINFLFENVVDILDSIGHRFNMLAIEDYGPINRTSGKITERAELCGLIKRHLLTFGHPFIKISPKALKNFATGNGNAKKEDIIAAAARMGVYPPSFDEADAFFLSLFAQYVSLDKPTGQEFTLVKPD